MNHSTTMPNKSNELSFKKNNFGQKKQSLRSLIDKVGLYWDTTLVVLDKFINFSNTLSVFFLAATKSKE